MRRSVGMRRNEQRVCCVCGAVQLARAQYNPRDVRVMSFSALLYYRGQGKGTLANAPKVCACEACMTKAAVNPQGDEGGKIGRSIVRALADCFSNVIMTEQGAK